MYEFSLRHPVAKIHTLAGFLVIVTVAVIFPMLPFPPDVFRGAVRTALLVDLAITALAVAILFPLPRRAARAAAFLFVALLLMVSSSYAADSIPETVAQAASDSNKVTIAWGNAVSQWASAIGWLILSGVGVAIAKIGGPFGAILSNSRVQLLIKNGVDYGINAVDGAVAGKTLDVNVGNAVLAKALQYALDNSSTWLQSWAGGPEGIAKKIWAALNLGEGVSDDQIQAVVAQVTAAK